LSTCAARAPPGARSRSPPRARQNGFVNSGGPSLATT
jgi:hypothetical protein